MRLRRLFRRRPEKRYEILNHLIRTRGYQDYLEIGVSTGRSITRVRCRHKTGVDPNPRVEPRGWTLYAKPSDEFFASNREHFDLVFIDGLHLAEQVFRDLLNSLSVLRPGGMVLLHDCHPVIEIEQRRETPPESRAWKGDVWKAIVHVRRSFPEIFCRVIDLDQGMGVAVPRQGAKLPETTPDLEADAKRQFDILDYEDLEGGRNELLGLEPDLSSVEEALRRQGIPTGV